MKYFVVHTPLLMRIFLLAAIMTAAASVYAQQNPFLSGSDTQSDASDPSAAADGPPANTDGPPAENGTAFSQFSNDPRGRQPSRFMQWINEFQRQLYGRIAGAMQAVKRRENRGSVLFVALGAAFLYGLLHALGPGHRKTVIFSYFLAEDAPVMHGVAAGVLLAALHGAAAIGLILPIYYLLRGSLLITFNSVSRYIEAATFGFIAVFGAVMLAIHLIQMLRGTHDHAHEPGGLHTGAGAADETSDRGRRRKLLLLIIGSGLVPCPGAAMVLMFALSMQMTVLGLMAVGAMSLGMAVTISAVAVVTLGARATLSKKVAAHHKLTSIIHTTLELGGYVVIFFFGLVMTLAVL
ncbi:MAG: nickel/cobalt transporter [bacterium]